MRLKPKHVRRLILLAAAGGVLVAVAFSLVFVRDWQTERLNARYRAQALSAFEKNDYYTTLVNAGSYLKRGDKSDPDILLAYAEARAKLQEFDGHHISDAIPYYVQYLDVKPEDEEVRLELLKLYNLRQFYAEAAALAMAMIPAPENATAGQFPVLREEAFARLQTKEYDSARLAAILKRMTELDFAHPSAWVFWVHATTRLDGRTADPARTQERLKPLFERAPDSPAALIAAAAAKMVLQPSGWREECIALLGRATGLGPTTDEDDASPAYTDAESPVILVQMLDAINAFDLSLRVLRDAEDRLKLADFKPLLLRRLWQNGLVEEVEARSRGVDVSDITADPMVLVFRALALRQLDRAAEAEPLIAALGAREGDFRTSTWAEALPLAQADTNEEHVARIEALRAIIKNNPYEPVFHVWIGDSLAALGRNDEARAEWRDAVANADGRPWAFPWIRTAETLLLDGRLDEALAACMQAQDVAPGRVAVPVLFFEIQAARIQKFATDPAAVRADCIGLLERLRQFRADLDKHAGEPGIDGVAERLIVPEVVFLSRSGDKAAAASAAMDALNGRTPLGSQTLNRLSMAATIEQLGITDAFVGRTGGTNGETATLVLGRALNEWAKGRTEVGVRLLRDEIKAHPDSAEAHVALARFLEIVGDKGLEADALAAWKGAGERFQDNLGVQRACLAGKTIAADAEFVEATIARYRTLAGISASDEDNVIRLARARTLLRGNPGVRERDRAIGLIRRVTEEQPGLVEAKLLLASALSIWDPRQKVRPDLPRAIAALTDAYNADPSSVLTALELARLHQLLGQFDRAREHLNRIAQNRNLNWKLRLVAAEMLVKQGDLRPVAQAELAEIAAQADVATLPKVLVALAEIHEAQREPEAAAKLYDRLSGIAADPNSIFMTARHYTLRKQPDRVRAVLDRIEALGLGELTREVVEGRLAAALDDLPGAARHFERAVELDPRSAEVWRQYTAAYMRAGSFKDAAAVAARGVAANSDDMNLAVLHDQAKLLLEGENDPELNLLVRSLVQTTDFRTEPTEIVRVVKELREQGRLNSAEDIVRLADRYSSIPAVQIYAANRMRMFDVAGAVRLVNRAMTASPTDPGPARLAAEIYHEMGEWQSLIAAAEAWRGRDASRSPEPDLAIAEAHLKLGQPDKGIEALRPHLQNAIANPDDRFNPGIINIYAKLLIAAGREKEALDELTPVFEASPMLRLTVGMTLAGMDIKEYESARSWREKLLAMTPVSQDQRLAAANVLAMLSSRFSDKHQALLEEAKGELIAITTGEEPAKPLVWELLGIIHTQLGENEAAKPAYRKAIELDPARLDSMNNLAFLLMNEGALDEALALAERAVESGKSPNPNHLDTLASIHNQLASAAPEGAAAIAHHESAAALYWRIAGMETRDVGRLRTALGEAMMAANLAGNYELALSAVEQYLLTGLDADLAAKCRNNEAAFLLQLNRGRDDLERALASAESAVRHQASPSYLDTLGWAHLALGEASEAQAAFERGIKAADAGGGPLPASVVGLATVLAGADEPGRARAEGLLAGLDPATLDRVTRERYDRVNSVLESGGR